MFVHQRQGSLEVICGPMFSGKSEELIRRIKRAIIARQKVQVFKPALLAKAEYVTKLQAICMVCGGLAGRTQRMVHTGGQVLVGAAEAYEARCRHCHEVPHATGQRLLEEAPPGS